LLNNLLRTSCFLTLAFSAAALSAPIFQVHLPRGLDFVLQNSPTPQKYLIETMPGGVALLDYNNDGLLDIFLVNGGHISSPMQTPENFERHDPRYWNRLYRQNKDGSFTDVTDQAGLAANIFGTAAIALALRGRPVETYGAAHLSAVAGALVIAGLAATLIAGMAAAAEFTLRDRETEQDRQSCLRDQLWNGIAAAVPQAHQNGDATRRLSNTLNVSFVGLDSEMLLIALDLKGVCASSGSACMVGSVVASHVLLAMGLPIERARSAVRFSLGKQTTADEIEKAGVCRPRARRDGRASRRNAPRARSLGASRAHHAVGSDPPPYKAGACRTAERGNCARHEARQAVTVRGGERLHQMPAGEIRHADVSDFPGADQRIERGENFLRRRLRVQRLPQVGGRRADPPRETAFRVAAIRATVACVRS